MYEVGGEEGVDYVGGYTQCMRLGEVCYIGSSTSFATTFSCF